MCFSTDYEWCASITTDETLPATTDVKCCECRRVIPIGEPVRHVFMQEHEICRHDPAHEDYDGPETDEEGCPEDCEHDYGETFDIDICQACDQLIEAIHQHELAEGCDEDESRPAFGELYDAMSYADGPAYLAKAEVLYPGITARLPENFPMFRDRDD